MPSSTLAYPLRLTGRLSPQLSRWRWLVKWLLAIPHFVALIVLGFGFVGASVLAWFAILITGRYPRRLFAYNVGVMRWSWRVGFYANSALGTDNYPPFTLKDVPDYPATLEVDYPESLSRRLVLVKWLLGVPALSRRRRLRRRCRRRVERDGQRLAMELGRSDRPAGLLRRRHTARHRPLPRGRSTSSCSA